MSGGRTSAYMVEKVLELQAQGYFSNTDFVITFANTGREHEKTLEFVNNCDERWRKLYNNKVIWLEAVVHEGRRPCSHKEVHFDSADRDGKLFEEVVAKYGLPNNSFYHCTRELKENTIMSYLDSLGEKKGHIDCGVLVPATYETWIGIRADEPKRLNGNRSGKQYKVFPLAGELIELGASSSISLSCDKQDVLDFWEDMPFDLNLPEHLGNCIDCHKKSFKKLKMVYEDMGEEAFRFPAYLDNKYSKTKAQVLDGGEIKERKRFRGYRDTRQLIAMFSEIEINTKDYSEESGGCSESCEAFMDSNKAEEQLDLFK
tara:strand:- start:1346 stop:2293 length:948 start_codon:yes stop_codon:yes gene_type:complete